ncbi:YceI family protein [soil metagenome]
MSTSTDTALQTYSVDPSHSQVGFTARHMGFSKVRGSFSAFDATIQMEGDDLSTLAAEATIETASITTNDEKRDAHLKSDDFFSADQYAQIAFKSREVSNVSGDSFTLLGDLTIRDKTVQVELDGTFLGTGTDPWGGQRIAFEAEGKISRKDFGLTWNQVLETGGVLVSDQIVLVLEVQATAS